MHSQLADAVEVLLGVRPVSMRAVGGGDIGDSFHATLADGDQCFVKHYHGATPELPQCEARGLSWLAEPGCLAVAGVRAVSDAHPILVLDWIESAPRRDDFDEALGRGLAALHRAGPDRFGFPEDNFIGSLRQSNTMSDSWPDFYGQCRLSPLLRRARDDSKLDEGVVRDAESLITRLDLRCGPPEPPARLHGDLWGGNLMVGNDGAACLIDPAVYGGHREIDIAMMRLFGGFSPRTFAAYDEQYPLAAGADERVGLYQLYPQLVHVLLFGGGYASSFASTVRQYL
jgi:fructosamine-3-kinase